MLTPYNESAQCLRYFRFQFPAEGSGVVGAFPRSAIATPGHRHLLGGVRGSAPWGAPYAYRSCRHAILPILSSGRYSFTARYSCGCCGVCVLCDTGSTTKTVWGQQESQKELTELDLGTYLYNIIVMLILVVM